MKLLRILNHLAAASEQQNATSQQISTNVELINNVTQQATESTEQISRAAENLNTLTINLQKVVDQFKLDGNTKYNEVEYNRYDVENVKCEEFVS